MMRSKKPKVGFKLQTFVRRQEFPPAACSREGTARRKLLTAQKMFINFNFL